MKWYRSLSIRGQLVFALVIMFAGFVAVGVTYALSITLEKNTFHEAEILGDFKGLVEDTHLTLVDARRIEKTFELTKNPKLLLDHARDMDKLTSNLEKLKATVPDAEEATRVDKVSKQLQIYRKAFDDEKEAISKIGLDAKSGLLGDLNKSARSMEKQLTNTGYPELLVSLLQMRRFEKNYLLDNAEAHVSEILEHEKLFNKLISTSSLSNAKKAKIDEEMGRYQKDIEEIVAAKKRAHEDETVLAKTAEILEKEFDVMLLHTKQLIVKNEAEAASELFLMEVIFVAVLVFTAVVVSLVFVLLMRKLSSGLGVLMGTIAHLAQGDYAARTGLKTSDELGQLGQSLDKMLDDRLAGLVKAEKENDQLNDSIIEVIEAVSLLSDKDLTVSVPVAADVTGAVADSINQMARQTAAVLGNIRAIAEQVEIAAQLVRTQGDKVTGVAENERKIVENTINSLDKAAQTMNSISSRAEACNDIAGKASQSTELALQAVNNTVDGMANIREIISETEKRIKRLGERSQEINGIVDIINTVAERTHVLALNASMQAAAAGEAGRGFAVVADEVQRLAEGSRTSTSQISELVNSIQSETAETMVTMNKVITQVVDGSELAEQAGKQMADTRQTTAELVDAVAEIAIQSTSQAKVSNDIRKRASLIQQSTQETGKELVEQATQTQSLVEYADSMLESMREFKLPVAK